MLLTLTGKLAAYLLLMGSTSITSCSIDSYSELESTVLFELSISVLSGVLSHFVGVSLAVPVSEVISFT